MKNTLSTVIAVVLCVLLVAVALCIGTVRGWSAERGDVLNALTSGGEMHALMENRGMDAANLAVVAARHLAADDEDLLSLRSASALLLSGTEDAQALLEADRVITDVAVRFAEDLPGLASVQASTRDKAYVSMLTSTLGKKTGLTHTYTRLVEDFNQRLTTTLSGKVAMLLGVDPLPAPTAHCKEAVPR